MKAKIKMVKWIKSDSFLTDASMVQTPEVFRKTPKVKIQFAGPYRAAHRNKKNLYILISNSRERKEPPNHTIESLLMRESENAHSCTFYLFSSAIFPYSQQV